LADPSAPWYERYFTADYWTYATAEYTAERTAAEVAHLAGVLPPGGRLPQALLGLLHDWYLAGWLRIGERHE